jgi:hypothetical protein
MITLIGLLAFAGSAAVGLVIGIPEPKIHDEFSYLLAADTFAHGRLTNPTHPMWMHFESFHIIQQPTYMSKYLPAQGLLLAAAQMVTGHPIVGVWIGFALMCAAICWMLYAWTPPCWALYGSFLAVIHPYLGIAGYWAQSYWGGAVAATGGALVLGGVRRLMHQPRVLDALLTALGLGILATSRPYEGLLVSLPVGVMLLRWMVSKRGPAVSASIKQILLPMLTVLVLVGGWMSYYNFRVTGNALRLPYQIHEETYSIAPLFIWQKPSPEPAYHHQVLRDFHKTENLGLYEMQRTFSGFVVKNIVFLGLAALYYLNVFAIPLIGMFTVLAPWVWRHCWARRGVVIYLILIFGLLMETYMVWHYLAPITALNYFFVLSAMRLWHWRDQRVGRLMFWLVPLLAALVLVKLSYETIKQNHLTAWPNQRARLLEQLNQQDGHHLIIVKYGPSHSVHDEWVYNEADIDGAKVVWARAMDPKRNCQLMEYFKQRRIWSLEIDGAESASELKPYPANRCQ